MVAFGSEFDAPEQAHGRIAPLIVFEHDGVEILDGDPPKDDSRLFNVVGAPGDELSDEITVVIELNAASELGSILSAIGEDDESAPILM